MELGESPEVAAEKGGAEVALPVLAATLTTAVVFFPVTFLYGVSRFLFSALALSVVLSLFASYIVAMTVVPLFCAKLIKAHPGARRRTAAAARLSVHVGSVSITGSIAVSLRFSIASTARRRSPWRARLTTVIAILGVFVLSSALVPALGLAYFPRTDPGQFVINLKAPTGTRLEVTEQEVAKVEDLVRRHRRAAKICASSSRTSARLPISPPSTPATPPRTPRLSR